MGEITLEELSRLVWVPDSRVSWDGLVDGVPILWARRDKAGLFIYGGWNEGTWTDGTWRGPFGSLEECGLHAATQDAVERLGGGT